MLAAIRAGALDTNGGVRTTAIQASLISIGVFLGDISMFCLAFDLLEYLAFYVRGLFRESRHLHFLAGVRRSHRPLARRPGRRGAAGFRTAALKITIPHRGTGHRGAGNATQYDTRLHNNKDNSENTDNNDDNDDKDKS